MSTDTEVVVEPILITLAQAADLAQVGMDRIRQWSYEPGFPVIRTTRPGSKSGQVRIHRRLFDQWLAQRARAEEYEA